MKRIAFVCTVFVFVMGCTHEPDQHPDPTITVVKPDLDPPTYFNGDTIYMKMTLADEDELHEASVYIRSDADTFFAYTPYVHELQSFEVDTLWVVNGVTVINLSAFITVVAHNHHEKSATINIPVSLFP